MNTSQKAHSVEERAILNLTTKAVLADLAGFLGPKDYEVFVSHFLHGESIQALATFYEVDVQSIKNRLARTNRKISGRVESGPLGFER